MLRKVNNVQLNNGIERALFPGIGRLTMSYPLNIKCTHCTAFAISKYHIMTAAHCLTDLSGRKAKYVKFGKAGTGPGTSVFTANIKKCKFPTSWEDFQSDYGVCLIDSLVGRRVPTLQLAVPHVGGSQLTTVGYPASSPPYNMKVNVCMLPCSVIAPLKQVIHMLIISVFGV